MSDRLDAAVRELVAAIREEIGSSAAASPDRLLSIDAAAGQLGIGRSALYERITSGDVRSIKVGRRRLVPASAIDTFIKEESNV